MFVVYAIYNKTNDKIYIGQTTNIDVRIQQHNDKIFDGSYTSRFNGTWELIYQESVENRQKALERKKQLKSYRGREFIKKYIPR